VSAKVILVPDSLSEEGKACADSLRDLLEEAENGQNLALAVAFIAPSHAVGSVLQRTNYHNALLGAVTTMQHDLLHNGDVPNE
jgi:hypothetical protein